MSIFRKAIVISNCQCLPLAHALTLYSRDTLFDFWGVHILSAADRSARITEFVSKARRDYDLVISIPLSDAFGELSLSKIRDSFVGIPVVLISQIYFSGLHPDLSYLSSRFPGPMGEYHSKLALLGYLKGMSAAASRELFCDEVYRKMGFYDEYDISMAELVRRDRQVDVPVTKILPEILRSSLAFYTVNHPTGAVFAPYADTIARYLQDHNLGSASNLLVNPLLTESSLAKSTIFPIYPEVAARHGVATLGSYSFKPPGNNKNPIDLDSFLVAQFAAFEKIGDTSLSQNATSKDLISRFDNTASSSEKLLPSQKSTRLPASKEGFPTRNRNWIRSLLHLGKDTEQGPSSQSKEAISDPLAPVSLDDPKIHVNDPSTATSEILGRTLLEVRRNFQAGEYDQAAKLCEQTFKSRPNFLDEFRHPVYAKEMLRINLAQGNIQAAKVFSDLLRSYLDPRDVTVELLYARHAAIGNDPLIAKRAWQAVLDRSPNHTEAIKRMSDLHMRDCSDEPDSCRKKL